MIVWSITAYNFVKFFLEFEDPIDEAVKDFIKNFPYKESIPTWLESSLSRYVKSKLELEAE